MRTSTLRGAPRCAAPAAAWRRSEACGSAALGGARRRSVTLSGAQRPRRRGGARQHVAQQRSAALGGARLPSAALGGAQRPRQHGGARQHVAARIVALGNDRFGTCSGARTPTLGGVPLHSAEVRSTVRTSPVARHAAASPQALGCWSRASPSRRTTLFPSRSSGPLPCTVLGSVPLTQRGANLRHPPRGAILRHPLVLSAASRSGGAQRGANLRHPPRGAILRHPLVGLGRRRVAGRPYFLRGPRVRSHARSSGPFPSRFSGPLPQLQTDVMQAVLGSAPMHGFQCSDPRSRVETVLLPHTRSRGASARSLIGERKA